MKELVLFAFVVLGCSLATARLVTKCELKQQLMVAFHNLPNNITVYGLSEDIFLAKVVCHVEHLSNFNTSAVTVIRQKLEKQSEEDSSESGSESSERRKSKPRKHKQGRQNNKEYVDMSLYGLFQLPEGLVCSSKNNTLPNMCDISCDKLTDEDTSDDINCVVKLISELVTKGSMSPNSKELWKVVKELLEGKCNNLENYFIGC